MISAAHTFRKISQKFERIETNLAVVEPYERALLHLSRWPGFFVTDQAAFHDEVQAIRYYLSIMSLDHTLTWIKWDNYTLPEPYHKLGVGENTLRLSKIVQAIWPNARTEFQSIKNLRESESHIFMDRLILASTYYRHRCEQLNRAIIQVQRRFKERVYAPGGTLMLQASQRFYKK
jgi:hypothetical protein